MTCTIRRALLVPLALALACGDSGDVTTTAASDTTGDSDASASETDATTAGPTGPGTSGSSGSTGSTGSTTGPSTTDPSTTVPSTTDPSTSTTAPSTTDPSTTDPSTTDPSTTGTTTGTTGEFCMQGEIVCEGGDAKVCDGMGGWESESPCSDECADGIGCVLCIPDATSCEGDEVLQCNEMGDGWEPVETCDGLQGLSCDPDLGDCVGECANLGLSYIGCDYYPTVTLQYDLYNTAPKDEFAVAVANTSGDAAMVTVTRGQDTVAEFTVAGDSVQVTTLPWVNELTKGNGPTVKVVDGAYRLRSTRPVTVYQFNPLESTTTNDASLLLPVNTWQLNYMVASRARWSNIPGFYAVVASQDQTTVELSPSSSGGQVQAGAGVQANGAGQVTLDEGDVLEVVSGDSDLTGTIVVADKPVQVFGGHKCTNVPANITACDHLEEAMFPIETLAKEYIVVPPVQVPNNNLDKAQMVRVIASEDDTTLVFEPDQPVGKDLAKAGDWVEIAMTTAAFKVSSAKKIMVAQYMVGQSANFGTSDPSMLLTVPAEQFRTDYLFFAETNWVENFVDIVAPDGAQVSVDGQNVGGWQAVGNTGFSVAHVKLSNAGDGSHSVAADQKVGISVYGVQSAGSYWFPGGLDLELIPQ